MAITKYLNYYQDDDNNYRRIPWDTWLQDGVVLGLSPVGIKNQDTVSFDANGVVTCDLDFLDVADEGDAGKRDAEISSLEEQTDERTLTLTYDNVCAYYESDFSQTYELDYDKPSLKE